MTLKPPFPYFGGKAKAASIVWRRFGNVRNYIEPFAGSAAMLLARPSTPTIETLNDANCFIANFWRAVQKEPVKVARACNHPVNEADLHAWHRYLVLSARAAAFRQQVREDPEYFDPIIAGKWVWGLCQWIGSGWCNLNESEGWVEGRTAEGDCEGRRPVLSVSNGVLKRQMPSIGGDCGASGRGVHRKLPRLSGCSPAGVKIHAPMMAVDVKRPALGNRRGIIRGWHEDTCERRESWLIEWFHQLQDRLRPVRVCCGDWKRVCSSPSVTTKIGLTGVFLDPPYLGEVEGIKSRDSRIYSIEDLSIANDVREWCLARGHNPLFRIALCGLEGEHNPLEDHGWTKIAWRSRGGYGNRRKANANRDRERIWFSPHCLDVASSSVRSLFE